MRQRLRVKLVGKLQRASSSPFWGSSQKQALIRLHGEREGGAQGFESPHYRTAPQSAQFTAHWVPCITWN